VGEKRSGSSEAAKREGEMEDHVYLLEERRKSPEAVKREGGNI